MKEEKEIEKTAEKTVGKSIGSALVVILALVIVIELVCCGLIYFVFNDEHSSSSETSTTSEQTTLKVAQPGKKEMKIEDSISITAEGYVKKQKKKTETKKKESKKKEEKKEDEKADSKEYVCPTSNSALLTDADIKGLSSQELNYAKNEIYARHGRMFDSQELQDYFNSKSWYKGIYSASDFDANYSGSLLTEVERKNVEFLRNAENNASTGGYELDE